MNAALRPPLPSVAMRPAERRDVLVICSDDSLLIELGALLGEGYRVHAVDTADRIGSQVDTARWIGIVDADSLGGANGVLSQLESQYPRCPLIVITARPESWVGSIACGAVLSVIGRKQIAAGRLSDAMLAAEDRLKSPALDQLQASQPGGAAALSARFQTKRPARRSLWMAGAALLLALGAGAAWLYHRDAASIRSRHTAFVSLPLQHSAAHPSAPPGAVAPAGAWATQPAQPGQVASPSAPAPQSVLELLSAARVAFRDQRLLPQQPDGAPNGEGASDGGSALELYGQILRQDPRNDEALAGVKRLLVVGGNRITMDVAGGQLDDAMLVLNVFKAAGVNSVDLQQWSNAISAAEPKWLAQRAAQAIAAGDFKAADALIAQATNGGADAATVKALHAQESARKLDLQLRAMARQVDAAIDAGVLLPPATDNARARLASMRSVARTNPLTLQAQQGLQEALVQAGERATRAAQFDTAERDLNAAMELGNSTLLTLARRQLQAARDAAARRVKLAALVAPPADITASHAPPPAGAVATAPASTPPRYIAAQPTRALPGDYPITAKGQNGSVVVEFTLSANGKASNLTVVQSDPPGVFDRAAISAVKRGRYSTRELVNRRPARARIIVRFTPG